MRNFSYIFLILITFNKSNSQDLLGQSNTVEITKCYFFDSNEFNEPTIKEMKVFDKKGRLIKDIKFGLHHNNNLKLIGNIRSYEFKKNKLISEKTYISETEFKKKQVQFYWNYIYKDFKKIGAVSNHSNCEYKYDEKNRLKECIISNWNSEVKRYLIKYNNDDKIVEKTQFYNDSIRNWTITYTKKGDTLILKQNLFNYPKEKDTTISTRKEVFKNDRLQFSHIDHFGICEKRYFYNEQDQLILIFAKVLDETKKELKTELIYFQNGLIEQIKKYELKNNDWILKQRTDFNVNGRESILNKIEIKNINQILINGENNWLQDTLKINFPFF